MSDSSDIETKTTKKTIKSKKKPSLLARVEAAGIPTKPAASALDYFKERNPDYSSWTRPQINKDSKAKELFNSFKIKFDKKKSKYDEDLKLWKEKNPELAQEMDEASNKRKIKLKEARDKKKNQDNNVLKKPKIKQFKKQSSPKPEKPKKKVKFDIETHESVFKTWLEENKNDDNIIQDIKLAFSIYEQNKQELQKEYDLVSSQFDNLESSMKKLSERFERSNDLSVEIQSTLDEIALSIQTKKQMRSGTHYEEKETSLSNKKQLIDDQEEEIKNHQISVNDETDTNIIFNVDDDDESNKGDDEDEEDEEDELNNSTKDESNNKKEKNIQEIDNHSSEEEEEEEEEDEDEEEEED